jgi:hypothetical protein
MSELFPTKTIALEYVSCTEQSREYEFNRWYNKVYIPDLLKTVGIANVYRYRHVAPELGEGQVRYLTVFRIMSDDAWKLMHRVRQLLGVKPVCVADRLYRHGSRRPELLLYRDASQLRFAEQRSRSRDCVSLILRAVPFAHL